MSRAILEKEAFSLSACRRCKPVDRSDRVEFDFRQMMFLELEPRNEMVIAYGNS